MTLLGELERSPDLREDADAGVLRFITAGSVDDGKSTLIGRLLHDTHALPEDQLQALQRASARRGLAAPDLSLLTDGLEAEREQGITIDVAYRYFATPRHKFIIADTPGHAQYTRNMVTGASGAEVAVILVDARKGVLEQTRRHTCIAHMLGIRHIFVAVNKMDLAGWSEARFEAICAAFRGFAAPLAIPDLRFFPVSALLGDQVVAAGSGMPWYRGVPLLTALESVRTGDDLARCGLRFPVQLVQRPGPLGASRCYLGRVASGAVRAGDEVTLWPAAMRARIPQVVAAQEEIAEAAAGDSIGLILDRELDISRGDLIAGAAQPPALSKNFTATLCWLSATPLPAQARLLLRQGTRTVRARLAALEDRLDIQTLERRPLEASPGMNDIFSARLTVQQPLAFDPYAENRATGAFILIDEDSNETLAAGLIRAAL
jgi:sulfate adenylyltransferase subunit 1